MFRALLAVSILAFAQTAFAVTMLARVDEQNWVRLYDTPCTETALLDQMVYRPYWDKFRRSDYSYDGRMYKSCWVLEGYVVYVIADDGSVTPIPIGAFEPEEGV